MPKFITSSMLKCINDDFWFIELEFTLEKRVQVDLSMVWMDPRYTPIVPIEKYYENLIFSLKIKYLNNNQKKCRKKPMMGGQVLCAVCVCVSDVFMLWMNYTWISLFSWHHFSSLETYSSVFIASIEPIEQCSFT